MDGQESPSEVSLDRHIVPKCIWEQMWIQQKQKYVADACLPDAFPNLSVYQF